MSTYNSKVGDPITLTEATDWTANFRSEHPTMLKGHFFGEDIINDILNQSGCIGIRMYHAIDDNHDQHLVLVGVDSEGNDLYNGIVADRGLPSPPYVSSVGPLK